MEQARNPQRGEASLVAALVRLSGTLRPASGGSRGARFQPGPAPPGRRSNRRRCSAGWHSQARGHDILKQHFPVRFSPLRRPSSREMTPSGLNVSHQLLRMGEVLSHLEAHLAEPIDVARPAQIPHVSRSTLHRTFRRGRQTSAQYSQDPRRRRNQVVPTRSSCSPSLNARGLTPT
jgi:hypothetical protein